MCIKASFVIQLLRCEVDLNSEDTKQVDFWNHKVNNEKWFILFCWKLSLTGTVFDVWCNKTPALPPSLTGLTYLHWCDPWRDWTGLDWTGPPEMCWRSPACSLLSGLPRHPPQSLTSHYRPYTSTDCTDWLYSVHTAPNQRYLFTSSSLSET